MTHHSREGIYIKNEVQVNFNVRRCLIEFGKWLRDKKDFPVRLVVYVKKNYRFRASNNELVTASFFAPYDKNVEPYIRIATGDYDELLDEFGLGYTLSLYLLSMAHEIAHYEQWIDDKPFSECEADIRAEKIVESYIDFKINEINSYFEKVKCNVYINIIKIKSIYSQSPLDVQLTIIVQMELFNDNQEIKKWLIELTKDINFNTRYYAISALSSFEGKDVIEAVKQSLLDKEEMVRIYAVQTLEYVGDESLVELLFDLLSDSSPLVRGYTAVAISTLTTDKVIVTNYLEKMISKEKTSKAKLRIYVGLYNLGKKEVLPNILKYLFSQSNDIKIPTIIYLTNIADKNNKDIILHNFEKLSQIEDDISIKKELETAKKELNEI